MSEEKLLPVRPKPLAGELCSSWLLRLAACLCITLLDLRRVIAPRIRIPFSDPDRTLGVHNLRVIAEKTGVELEAIRQTLLRFDSDERTALWPESWLLPIGSWEYTKAGVGYQYCPSCLAEGTAYFRKIWRFGLLTACTRHGCEFVDACQRCSQPIHAFPNGLLGLERVLTASSEPPFVTCTNCGWDLRTGKAAAVSAEDLEVQVAHERWLEELGNLGQDPSEYFWLLSHAVDLFSKEIGTIPFIYLPVRHRIEVLRRADWLLADDRWTYIQSISSVRRQPLGSAVKKPASSVRRDLGQAVIAKA